MFLILLSPEKFVLVMLEHNVIVVVTRPLLRDEGMAEDHGVPEAGKLRRA